MNFTRLVAHGFQMLMPFLDQIAVRSLVFFAILIVLTIILGAITLAIRFLTDLAIPGWATVALLGLGSIAIVSLGNFFVIFSIFTQVQGAAFRRLQTGSEIDFRS